MERHNQRGGGVEPIGHTVCSYNSNQNFPRFLVSFNPEGSGPLNRHREPDLAPVLETPPGPVCIWLTRLAAPLLASGQPEGGGASGLGLLPHAPPIRAPGVAQMTPTLRLRPRVGRPPRACPHSGPWQGRLLGRPKAALVTVLVGPPPRPLLY